MGSLSSSATLPAPQNEYVQKMANLSLAEKGTLPGRVSMRKAWTASAGVRRRT